MCSAVHMQLQDNRERGTGFTEMPNQTYLDAAAAGAETGALAPGAAAAALGAAGAAAFFGAARAWRKAACCELSSLTRTRCRTW